MTLVCLTFDFDAVSLWYTSMKAPTPTPLSRGEFGALVGVPRILDLLARHALPATFFVPAHTAASYPAQVRAIHAAGHEIGLHGYRHETPVGLPREEEGRLLDASIAGLRAVIGDGYVPAGYRSPAWDLSANSVGLLLERGLLYDSSMMASDFLPYRARRNSRIDDHGYDPGEPTDLVEIPVAWELDDFPYFTFLNKPLYPGTRAPDDVYAIWRDEFDFCRELDGGVFTLTMHPQFIGRGPRLKMLERLIGHMAAQEGVRFATVADAARQAAAKL